MKKGLKLVLVVAIMCFLTGCYRVNTNMSINSDKSVDFEMIYAIDAAAMEGMADSMNGVTGEGVEDATDDGLTVDNDSNNEINYEQIKGKLESKGYKVEEYKVTEGEKKWEGVKVTKKFPNIDSISKSSNVKVEFNKMADESEEFDDSQLFSLNNGKYKAAFVYDFSTDGDNTDYSTMKSYFDLKYVLKLPNKSISNNATEVSKDGKTLTWDLEMGKLNEVNFEFQLSDSTTNSILPIIIGSGAVVVVAVIVLIIVKSKKKPEVTTQQ